MPVGLWWFLKLEVLVEFLLVVIVLAVRDSQAGGVAVFVGDPDEDLDGFVG